MTTPLTGSAMLANLLAGPSPSSSTFTASTVVSTAAQTDSIADRLDGSP